MNKYKKTIALLVAIILSLAVVHPLAVASESHSEQIMEKIDKLLLEYLENNTSDKIPVTVWLAEPELPSESIENSYKQVEEIRGSSLSNEEKLNTVNSIIAQQRRQLSEIIVAYNGDALVTFPDSFECSYSSRYAPTMYGIIDRSEVKKLAENKLVTDVYLTDDRIEEELNVSRVVVKANSVQSSTYGGYTGSGVKVGIYDVGIPDSSVLGIASANFIVDPSGSSTIDSHATRVASIIANQGVNGCSKGIAPGVKLYCSSGNSFYNTLDWMDDSNVNIVNISFGYTSLINTYSAYDKYVDYISYHSHITIVKSAGNQGTTGITSPGMAYNAITVGNVNINDTTSLQDDVINTDSSCYNVLTPNSSAYLSSKPDICAPGEGTYCGSAGTIGGTSAAAPHVTGALALMGQQDPSLLYVPSAMKAVAAAGINKSFKHYMPSQRVLTTVSSSPASSYIQYGAGMINCLNNRNIVDSQNYNFGQISPNVPSITVTISCTKNKPVRFAVVSYNQQTTKTGTPKVVDLNVEVCTSGGATVVSSSTSYNTLEIVDFTPTYTGNYTVYIDRCNYLNQNVDMAYAWL